jgi:hypothetical protein
MVEFQNAAASIWKWLATSASAPANFLQIFLAYCTGPIKASALFRAYNGAVAQAEA